MSQFRLLLSSLCVLTLLAVAHYFALEYFWYWTYPLIDIPVHFFGGLGMALLVTWFFVRFGILQNTTSRKRLLFILGGVLAIGILWEFFEVFIGVAKQPGYFFDTAHDLINDLCGAVLGYLLAKRLTHLVPS